MRRLAILTLLLGGLAIPQMAHAQGIQDIAINLDGTSYCYSGDLCANDTLNFTGAGALTGAPGVTSTSNLLNSGLGTITITLDNTSGSAVTEFADTYVFDPAAAAVFFDQYGIVNGTAAAGQSYQIDVPDPTAYDYNPADTNHIGTIYTNTLLNTYSNSNQVPGTASNYSGTCSTGSDCDDQVTMGLGLSFSLAADSEETITLDLSSTNPGGFSLQDVQPAYGPSILGGTSTSPEVDVYYSESATQACIAGSPGCGVVTPPTGVPEPGSLSLLAIGLAALAAGAFLKGLRKSVAL